jgi:hypothetical protein
MPKSQFDPFQGLLMPHPVVKKNLKKGEYENGGSLRVLKMKGGGKMRVKKAY